MSQPLSTALPTAGVKTQMPEIADKTWVKVKFVKVDEQNMVPDGEPELPTGKPCYIFRFETVENIKSKDGKVIEPGKPGSFLFERVYLRDKNNLTSVPERALQSIAKIQNALDNTGDPENTQNLPVRDLDFGPEWVARAVNRTCMAYVIIDGDYGNKIKEFRSAQDPKFKLA